MPCIKVLYKYSPEKYPRLILYLCVFTFSLFIFIYPRSYLVYSFYIYACSPLFIHFYLCVFAFSLFIFIYAVSSLVYSLFILITVIIKKNDKIFE